MVFISIPLTERCGDKLEPVQRLGQFYIEVWRSLGVPFGDNVKVVPMKEAVGTNPDYTVQLIDFSQLFTAVRLKTFSSPYSLSNFALFLVSLSKWST